MSPFGVFLAILLFGGGIGIIVSTTVNTGVDPVPKTQPVTFLANPEFYQLHRCSCKTDWPLATNERELSNQFFTQVNDDPDPRGLSSLVAFMGQFIDHDIVLSVSDPSQGVFSVVMTPTDAILNMTRNVFRAGPNNCREFLSVNTPQIDASTVYGSNAERLAFVRQPGSCKLKTTQGKFLPLNQAETEFIAGDDRSTEHSILSSMHTLWMREHNRLCDELAVTAPLFTQEEKFWKARQILIAKLQHIVYTEWLPTLFGSQAHLLYSIPVESSFGLNMAMEFSVVAYRYGHSQIPDPIGPFTLPSLFFNPNIVLQNDIDPLLSAAYTTKAQKVNTQVVDGLRNFMFSAGPNVMGEDLITRNLFRQREGGLAAYPTFKQCVGSTDASPGIDVQEPYIGLLSEELVPGSSLPQTIARVVAEQFRRLRENDPQFYTKISGAIGSYYWNEIQQTTLGKIIARNTGLGNVPKDVFRINS